MRTIESFAGIPHQEQYRHLAEFAWVICADLGIQMPNIRVGWDPFTGCCFDPVSNTVFLNTAQLDQDMASPLMVLAHELRHVYQWERRILHITEKWEGFETGLIVGRMQVIQFYWEGQEFEANGKYHHELPWEDDAIRYEEDIARRIQVKPYPRPDRDAGRRSA